MLFTRLRIMLTRQLTLANLVDTVAKIHRDRVMCVMESDLDYPLFPDRAISYPSFLRAVNRIGHGLLALGVRRYDRVLIYKTNGIDVLAFIYAVIKIGAVAVPVNPGVPAEVAVGIAEQVKPVAILTDQEQMRLRNMDRSSCVPIAHWLSADPPGSSPEGFRNLAELLEGQPDVLEPAYLPRDSVVALLHTSGTTGRPKLVMLTSGGLIAQARAASLLAPVGPNDLVVSALPWAHILGFAATIVQLIVGMRCYAINRFEPDHLLSAIERERATVFVGYPMMFTLMLEALRRKPYNLESIRYWHAGADAMHAVHIAPFTRHGALFRLFGRKLVGSVFTPGFGMSELGGPAIMPFVFPSSRVVPRCLGKSAVPGCEFRVADRSGRPLPRGQVGYLWVKTPGMLRGYWNNHETYTPNLCDGFFRTGDVVRTDQQGRLYFLDREGDVIRTNAGDVFSLEIEEVLLRHPAILECAVVAVPDGQGDVMPVAAVCLKPDAQVTEQELAAWGAQHLNPVRLPRHFVFMDLADLPLGATMKVQKFKLRDRFARQFEPAASLRRAEAAGD